MSEDAPAQEPTHPEDQAKVEPPPLWRSGSVALGAASLTTPDLPEDPLLPQPVVPPMAADGAGPPEPADQD